MTDVFPTRPAAQIGSSMVLTASGSGVLSPALAQHVHCGAGRSEVAQRAAPLSSRVLHPAQLSDAEETGRYHHPRDEHSGGASDAGAPEFIDFLSSRNADLAAIFNGGFAWLDDYMQKKTARLS